MACCVAARCSGLSPTLAASRKTRSRGTLVAALIRNSTPTRYDRALSLMANQKPSTNQNASAPEKIAPAPPIMATGLRVRLRTRSQMT